MTLARLFVYLVYAALLVGLVVLGVTALSSPTPWGGGDDVATEPTLTSFVSGGGGCADAVDDRASTEVIGTDAGTVVHVTGSVSVPDTNYVLDAPRLVREGPGEYSIDVTSNEATMKAGRNCPARAAYELSVLIPADAGPTTITVRHDGDAVTRASSGDGTSA